MTDRELILIAIQALVTGSNVEPLTKREMNVLEVLTLVNENLD